jgi:pyruvate dehydrogenase E1 component alpha subunit
MRQTPPPERRPAEELAAWRARDPVARLADALRTEGILDEAGLAALRAGVAAELAAAEAFAEASPFPKADALADHLFAS